MGIVMLAWMLNMYRKTVVNLVIVAVSLGLFAVGVVLERSQGMVGDVSFMSAMIPHLARHHPLGAHISSFRRRRDGPCG